MSPVHFVITTQATPDQVREALTDFTERRLRTWHRTLDPRTYEVRATGDTWAVARESTAGSPFWVVSRYDWSEPSVVRTTIEESSWGGDGTGSVRIAPLAGGGSRLEVEWSHTGMTGARDRLLWFLLNTPLMRRVVARLYVRALDEHAATQTAGG